MEASIYLTCPYPDCGQTQDYSHLVDSEGDFRGYVICRDCSGMFFLAIEKHNLMQVNRME